MARTATRAEIASPGGSIHFFDLGEKPRLYDNEGVLTTDLHAPIVRRIGVLGGFNNANAFSAVEIEFDDWSTKRFAGYSYCITFKKAEE